VHVRFSDDDRAGVSQLAYRRRVLGGDAAPEMLKGGSCRNPDGVKEVFYAYGDPVQEAFPPPLRYLMLGGLCVFRRALCSNRDESVELRLETLYSLKTRRQRIDRRGWFFAQRFS
jgi:hypothetical protein